MLHDLRLFSDAYKSNDQAYMMLRTLHVLEVTHEQPSSTLKWINKIILQLL